MPLSHQSRPRALPSRSSTPAVRDASREASQLEAALQEVSALQTENRALQAQNRSLREEATRESQQTVRLQTALEECMDLLLQVSNTPQQQQDIQAELFHKERERLKSDFDTLLSHERASFSTERDHMRAQMEDLQASYESAVSDLRRCVSHEERLKEEHTKVVSELDAVKARLQAKEEEVVVSLVGSAKAATALADERRKREGEEASRRELEYRLSTFSERDVPLQGLAADALRIRSQMQERRSQGGSDKWSLSPDNSPQLNSPEGHQNTPSRMGVPSLPSTPQEAGTKMVGGKHAALLASQTTPMGHTPYSALGASGAGRVQHRVGLGFQSEKNTPGQYRPEHSVDAI